MSSVTPAGAGCGLRRRRSKPRSPGSPSLRHCCRKRPPSAAGRGPTTNCSAWSVPWGESEPCIGGRVGPPAGRGTPLTGQRWRGASRRTPWSTTRLRSMGDQAWIPVPHIKCRAATPIQGGKGSSTDRTATSWTLQFE